MATKLLHWKHHMAILWIRCCFFFYSSVFESSTKARVYHCWVLERGRRTKKKKRKKKSKMWWYNVMNVIYDVLDCWVLLWERERVPLNFFLFSSSSIPALPVNWLLILRSSTKYCKFSFFLLLLLLLSFDFLEVSKKNYSQNGRGNKKKPLTKASFTLLRISQFYIEALFACTLPWRPYIYITWKQNCLTITWFFWYHEREIYIFRSFFFLCRR